MLLLKRQTSTAKGLVSPYLSLSLFKGFSVITGPGVGFQDVDKTEQEQQLIFRNTNRINYDKTVFRKTKKNAMQRCENSALCF